MTFIKRSVLSLLVAGSTVLISNTAFAWDPVRDVTGRTLKQHVERGVERTENSLEKLFDDPIEWIKTRPERFFAEICAAPAQIVNYNFQSQVSGNHALYSLPPLFIHDVQQFYSIDLRTVRYAVNVQTFNGNAVTIGNTIYFPRVINLGNRHDLWWMLHELEHTVQYQGRPRASKLCEYTLKSISHMSTTNHDWEHAADRSGPHS